MEKQQLHIKLKNTVRILIFLLIGILLIVFGVVAYFITENFAYFYLIAVANIFVIYGLIGTQVKKNHITYDAVFIKYRLNNTPVQRIKTDEILAVTRQENSLYIQTPQQENIEINVKDYEENSIEAFYNLLTKFSRQNRE